MNSHALVAIVVSVCVVCATALTLGLYWMGAGADAFWGLTLALPAAGLSVTTEPAKEQSNHE